jgi:Zn-dependent peptidase ImmA (M78 family)
MLPNPETVAEQILIAAKQRRPPTNIRAILAKWPQLSVVETKLDGDGFFVDLGEIGGEIFVKQNKDEKRKRFTLAHELGHFLVRHHVQHGAKPYEVEEWCNRFAAELLLPRDILAGYLKFGGISQFTERFARGAATFNVSQKAFSFRVSRLFPISIFNLLISSSSASIVDAYASEKFRELVGNDALIWSAALGSLIAEMLDADLDGQGRIQEFDRTILCRRVSKNSDVQKFLVLTMAR